MVFTSLFRSKKKKPQNEKSISSVEPDSGSTDVHISQMDEGQQIGFSAVGQRTGHREVSVREAIYQIAQAVNETRNLTELYNSIHTVLNELMPAQNFYIALYNQNENLLSFPYFVDEYDEPPVESLPGHGLTEYVLRTGLPLLASPDIFEKLTATGEVLPIGPPSLDWMGVPLKVDNHLIGVMVIQTYREGVRYSQEDLEILKFVSNQVAMAIVRKQAEESLLRRNQELAVLHAVAAAAAETTSEDYLIDRVTQVIGETLYPDHFGLLLLDPKTKMLRAHPSYRGIKDAEYNVWIPPGTGITGKVFQSGVPAFFGDISKNPDYIEGSTLPVKSEICVPLKVDNHVIGVINAESIRLDAFSSSDIKLLSTLAGQLTGAIERIRTQANEQLHANQIATIYEISQEIVGSSLDPEKVYLAIHQAVRKLMPCEAFIIAVLDSNQASIDAVYVIDKNGRFKGYTIPVEGSLVGHVVTTGETVFIPDLHNATEDIGEMRFGDQEQVRSIIMVPMLIGGTTIGCLSSQSYAPDVYSDDDLQMLKLLAAHAAIALVNARLHKETNRRADEMTVLVKVSSALRSAPTHSDMLPIILDQLCELLKITAAAIILKNQSTGEAVVRIACGSWKRLEGLRLPPDQGLLLQLIEHGEPFLNVNIRLDTGNEISSRIEGQYTASAVPLLAQDITIGALLVGCDSPFSEDEFRFLNTISDIAANAINRSTLHEQTKHQAEQLAVLSATERALSETLEITEIKHRLVFATFDLVPLVSVVWLTLFQDHHLISTISVENQDGGERHTKEVPNSQIPSFVKRNYEQVRKSLLPLCIKQDCRDQLPLASIEPPSEGLYIPLVSKGAVSGVIRVCAKHGYRFSQSEIEILSLLGNTAAIAVENARLFEETEKRLRRLAALRTMDMAISSSFDLRVTLNVLLDQITAQLGVDAAAVLMFNGLNQSLDYAAGRGFRSSTITKTSLRLGEELSGKAALERRLTGLSEDSRRSLQSQRLIGEDFVTYYSMPLLAKGQLKGVLEIFHRSHLSPDSEWLEFLETLAGDTAIAIDNTSLFNDLQMTNIELILAYDTTLEGWSRILELRRSEPEGHMQRILEMTINLALALGVSEQDIVNIRRGVLLHDIGIFGVPDNILHKPGPLTTDEWAVIRMHPIYAYDLLLPISYLKSALDIPYCHHEKWDGTGYPRGLKGNEIPLAARIFAVVDAWDALRSDRPFRSAWSDQKVVEYLRSYAGTHFEPRIVQVFLTLLSEA
ncbi:MAG: GAF domain-containing protein [Chloroflexi bacterium]|nr:MAG: GAF domain-containing protein [Chloroflexota bacterium]